MSSYFEEWPFYTTSPDKPSFIADRYEIKNELETIFSDFLLAKNSSFYCLAGMFGSGKSHFLKYFSFKLYEENNILFIYTPSFITDTKNFREFYVKTIGEQLINPEFLKRLKKIWRDCVQKMGVQNARKFLLVDISKNWLDLANILIVLLERINYDDFNELGYNNDYYIATSWLKGNKLNKRERETFHLNRLLENDEDAVKVFSALNNFLTTENSKSSFNGFLWIIDDCHFIKDITKKSRDQIQRGFKLCLDSNVKKYLFFMSFAVHTKEEVDKYLLDDLINRKRKTIILPQLNEKESMHFITDIIKNSKRINAISDLFPFTEESISTFVHCLSIYDPIVTPRIIHMELNNLVLNAQREIYPNIINVEYIIKYFNQKK